MHPLPRPPAGPTLPALREGCADARRARLAAANCDWSPLGASHPLDLPPLLRECAALLELTEASLARGSSLRLILTRAAADACEQVAEQCASWGDDPRLDQCAAQCRASATASRQVAQALAAAYPQWSRRLA